MVKEQETEYENMVREGDRKKKAERECQSTTRTNRVMGRGKMTQSKIVTKDRGGGREAGGEGKEGMEKDVRL